MSAMFPGTGTLSHGFMSMGFQKTVHVDSERRFSGLVFNPILSAFYLSACEAIEQAKGKNSGDFFTHNSTFLHIISL